MVIVPLNTRLATVELEVILADADARILLTDRDPGGLAALVSTVIRMGRRVRGGPSTPPRP